MFGNKCLRRDVNIGFDHDIFQLLPTITLTKTGKYFEINIQLFNIFIHICYLTYIIDDDEP